LLAVEAFTGIGSLSPRCSNSIRVKQTGKPHRVYWATIRDMPSRFRSQLPILDALANLSPWRRWPLATAIKTTVTNLLGGQPATFAVRRCRRPADS
jgi:hypothetical protein